MAKLKAEFTPTFKRDLKKLDKHHIDDTPLEQVIDLIITNTPESLAELRRSHNMHQLTGAWSGSHECHICNAGDWLLIWRTFDEIALMQRTGSHNDLFR